MKLQVLFKCFKNKDFIKFYLILSIIIISIPIIGYTSLKTSEFVGNIDGFENPMCTNVSGYLDYVACSLFGLAILIIFISIGLILGGTVVFIINSLIYNFVQMNYDFYKKAEKDIEIGKKKREK